MNQSLSNRPTGLLTATAQIKLENCSIIYTISISGFQKKKKSCATMHKDIRWKLTKPQLKQNLIAFNGPILPVIKLMYFLFLTGAIWHLYNNNIIPVLVRNKENKILLAPKTSQLNVIAGSVKETLRNKPTRNRMKSTINSGSTELQVAIPIKVKKQTT